MENSFISMSRVLALAVLCAAACASKGPPPHITEVPIDDGTLPRAEVPIIGTASAETVPTPSAGTGLGGAGNEIVSATAGLLPSVMALGGASPSPGVGGGGSAGAGGGAAGGGAAGGTDSSKPPPKAERLSAVECSKVMDKYIELVGLSQGISPDAIGGVMTMVRNSVINEPNYANALNACARENTKTQYRCAMRAGDIEGWKRCLK
jgi:hypothetical protein